MKYLSTTEIARKWGVNRRTVQRYVTEGRIKGVCLIGKTWMIPEDTKKEDCLKVNNEEAINNDKFNYPFYLYRDFFNLKNNLKTKEEKDLYKAFEQVLANDSDKAFNSFNNIYKNSNDICIKIVCLYMLSNCALSLNKYPLFMKQVLELNEIFNQDFDHKEDMKWLKMDVDSYLRE